MAKILGDGQRQRTQAFAELQSYYRFDDKFGPPAKGNDKGEVEGLVGYVPFMAIGAKSLAGAMHMAPRW